MADLVERKIRTHARRLYVERGQVEGLALQDWVQAESTVLQNSILAPLYRRLKADGSVDRRNSSNASVAVSRVYESSS
jgi:hypothetical protein